VGDVSVTGDEAHRLAHRLRDEEGVERVAVQRPQVVDGGGVFG